MKVIYLNFFKRTPSFPLELYNGLEQLLQSNYEQLYRRYTAHTFVTQVLSKGTPALEVLSRLQEITMSNPKRPLYGGDIEQVLKFTDIILSDKFSNNSKDVEQENGKVC